MRPALLSLVWLVGCGSPTDKACKDWATGNQRIDTTPDLVRLVPTPDGLQLLAMAGYGVSWHPVAEDGSVGAELGSLLGGLPHHANDFDLLAVKAHGDGFRIYNDGYVVDVSEAGTDLQPILQAETGWPADLEYVSLTSVFVSGATTWAVWQGQDDTDDHQVGIGVIEDIDDQPTLVPVGAPFYDDPAPFRGNGVFDADAGLFWLDPHPFQVWGVDTDGVLQHTRDVQADTPSLHRWVQLPDGSLAGLWGNLWVPFSLGSRDFGSKIKLEPYWRGNGKQADQRQLDDGTLIVAIPSTRGGVSMRLGQGMLGAPVRSDVQVGQCTWAP